MNYTAFNKFIIEKFQKGEIAKEDAIQWLQQMNRDDAEKEDEIAVIGVACRFPQSDSKEEFWNNISMGKDCICSISDERKEQLKFNQRACIRDRGACNRCGSSTYSWRYF